MTQKKKNYWFVLFMGMVALLPGCSNEEEALSQPASQTWTASVLASKGGLEGDLDELSEDTRAVFYGGNSARYVTLWDTKDVVQVYKDGVNVGELKLDDSANKKYQFALDAYLSGKLTGSFNVGDQLQLYLPARDRSYTGQTGTIDDLSLRFSHQMTTVSVEAINGSNITLSKANMTHLQAYIILKLTDQNGNRLHPSKVTISASSSSANRIVTSATYNATTTEYDYEYGDIVINPASDYGEYPGELFVALLNEGYNGSTHGAVDYRITAVADGKTYVGPTDRAFSGALPIGNLVSVKRQMMLTDASMEGSLSGFSGGAAFGENGNSGLSSFSNGGSLNEE